MGEPDHTSFDALGKGPLPPRRALECFAVAETVTLIELESNELVAKCPVTGQTDLYRVTIAYRPAGWALETKSLKLYLATFQQDSEGIFAEHLADRIAADVADASRAEAVQVELVQNVRGGITTTVTAGRGDDL